LLDGGMTNSAEIAVSQELFAPVSREVELCYQTFGDPAAEPLLLIMGLAGPMTWWDAEFCERLASKGFYVIRYDNRDTGRSTKMRGRVTRQQLVAAFIGRRGPAPYSLADLAADGIGLLDHLNLCKAHVAGVSMGGMIAQTMAIEHPERVRSLVSIMSSTGARRVGWQDPKLLPRLLARRQVTRSAYVDTSVEFWQHIGSPGYPEDVERLQEKAGTTWDRGISGSGIMRQMVAILTQSNRTRALGSVTAPTLVIHGNADRMVHVSGGRATSAAIPGSELEVVDGMGHNMPRSLWPTLIDGIRRTADRA
jgi:pimeloyl-ACP methyl ester carboxylesterase